MSAPKTTPSTRGEIATGLRRVCDVVAYAQHFGNLVDLVCQWRTEWLRDAEPRRRLVSEKPERDSVIACKYNDGRWHHFPWRGGEAFDARVTGWVLLERAPSPKTLAEEARELATDYSGTPHASDEGALAWVRKAGDLLSRIAEGKSDEREVLPVDTIVSPDAVEEAAAKLFSKYDEIADNTDWEELGDNTQNDYRDVARGIIASSAAAERETCAKVCEEIAARAEGEWPPEGYWIGCKVGAKECCNAIRARGVAV